MTENNATPPRSLPKPYSNRDYDFFYAGLARRELLVQRCTGCGQLRNPPGPMCPHCQSLEWEALRLGGRGTVYSYTIHHHPPLPGFPTPHVIALVGFPEGTRLLGGLRGVAADRVAIGMPVAVEFETVGETPTYYYRPV